MPGNAEKFAKYQPKSEEVASDHEDSSDLQDTIEQTNFNDLLAFWKDKEATT